MAIDLLMGLQWGDEGKGKIVDYLAPNYDIIARFQGGPNAGHTLIVKGKEIVLHTIPSGILHDNIINFIGNGLVIDPVIFKKEVEYLEGEGIDVRSKLFISKKAHLILPTHRMLDAAAESLKGKSKIGSTLKGIAPAYMDKTGRNGLRIGDISLTSFKEKYDYLTKKHRALLDFYHYDGDVHEGEEEWLGAIEVLATMNLVNGEYYINELLNNGKQILAEGAQGSLLDIDFGTYPFVTSSHTVSASACIGLGIAPTHVREVIGIAKAYCTRVGNGPFPTELNDEKGKKLQKLGNEYGSTTGRPRRCGWLDLNILKYSVMINGVTQLIMTKVDILNAFDEINVCSKYSYLNDGKDVIISEVPFEIEEDKITPIYETLEGWKQEVDGKIPDALERYLNYIEEALSVKISIISLGPERDQIINRLEQAIA